MPKNASDQLDREIFAMISKLGILSIISSVSPASKLVQVVEFIDPLMLLKMWNTNRGSILAIQECVRDAHKILELNSSVDDIDLVYIDDNKANELYSKIELGTRAYPGCIRLNVTEAYQLCRYVLWKVYQELGHFGDRLKRSGLV